PRTRLSAGWTPVRGRCRARSTSFSRGHDVMAIFGPLLALDPTQPGTAAKSAAGKAYAVDDDALATPLPMTDLSGVTITDALSDANGIIQAFQVEDHDEVVW